MPKYGVQFSKGSFDGMAADAENLVGKWMASRGRTRVTRRGDEVLVEDEGQLFWCIAVPKEDLLYLARCTLFGGLSRAGCINAHPDSFANLWLRSGDETPNARFTRIFTSYPDEAALFWSWSRRQRRMREDTRKGKAREAVSMARLEQYSRKEPITADEIAAYLERRYKGGRYHSKKASWRASIEDAASEERGRISGKKRRKSPE